MKKSFYLTGIGLVSFLLIGTFFDLQIDQFVFIKNNGFSYFFEHLAPVIFATTLMIGAALIFWTLSFKTAKKLLWIFNGIIYVLGTLLGIFLCYNYIHLWGLVYGLLAATFIALQVRKIPDTLARNYRLAGVAILITGFCSMITVESIKPIVGRVRFRSMQENFDLFTRWYQVNGDKYLSAVPLKEEIKSFPSGHSQWAGTTISLSLLAMVNPKWQDKEKLIYWITIGYAAVLMLSRMMQGAHFLSDVTIGFSSAFLFFIISRSFIVQRKMDKSLLKNF